jgi:hypothetical protein
MRHKKSTINSLSLSLSLLIIFFAGLIISPTSASVLSNNYKQYKAKYKNKEDKGHYFKIKTLKKDNPKLYNYYKSICDLNKGNTKSLNSKMQQICHEYYTYKGYQNYIYYRDKYGNNDNE